MHSQRDVPAGQLPDHRCDYCRRYNKCHFVSPGACICCAEKKEECRYTRWILPHQERPTETDLVQLTGTSGGQDSLPKDFAPIPSQNIPETTNNDPQIAIELETRGQGNGAARDNLKSPLRALPSSSLDMESGYKIAGGICEVSDGDTSEKPRTGPRFKICKRRTRNRRRKFLKKGPE